MMTHHDVTHAPKMYTSAVPPFLCVSLHTGRPPLPSSNTTLPGMENAALASWTMRSLSAEARGTTRVAARARLVATRVGARRVGASAWRDPRDMARDMAVSWRHGGLKIVVHAGLIVKIVLHVSHQEENLTHERTPHCLNIRVVRETD